MKKRKIKVDDYEIRIMINALNELRNKIINEGGDTTPVDELLQLLIKEIE